MIAEIIFVLVLVSAGAPVELTVVPEETIPFFEDAKKELTVEEQIRRITSKEEWWKRVARRARLHGRPSYGPPFFSEESQSEESQ